MEQKKLLLSYGSLSKYYTSVTQTTYLSKSQREIDTWQYNFKIFIITGTLKINGGFTEERRKQLRFPFLSSSSSSLETEANLHDLSVEIL